jgi:hypothetical protein
MNPRHCDTVSRLFLKSAIRKRVNVLSNRVTLAATFTFFDPDLSVSWSMDRSARHFKKLFP